VFVADQLSLRLVPDELWALAEPLIPKFRPRPQGRLRLRFRRLPPRSVPPVIRTAGDPLSQRPHSAIRMGERLAEHAGPDPEFRIRVSDLYCLPSCASARFSAPQPAPALPLSAADALEPTSGDAESDRQHRGEQRRAPRKSRFSPGSFQFGYVSTLE